MFKKGWPNGLNKRVDLLDYKESLTQSSPQRRYLKSNDTRVRRVYYGKLRQSQREGYGVLNIDHSTHFGKFKKDMPVQFAVYHERDSNVGPRGTPVDLDGAKETNNSYIGTYYGGFHGYAKLLILDKNARNDTSEGDDTVGEDETEDEDEHQHPHHHVYYGKTKNGVAHGEGRWYYRNGEIYTGHLKNGIREGFGTLESIFGDRLVGNWSNDSFVFGTKSGPTVGSFAGHFNPDDGRFVFGKIIGQNGNAYIGECNGQGSANGFGISINHLENKKYIGEFKNGKRDGFGIYYDDVREGNPSTHDVEECDDLNDNYKCDNEEGQEGFSNGIDGNGSLRVPALKPKYVGLWYENKFVPYNEEVVEKEFANKNKSVEDHAKLWHSAFYTKKAWEIHYQANQVVESGYKAALEAIATSRFVRYRVGKVALESLARAKNSHALRTT